MSNYIEYNDQLAFHPGYYLKEIVVEWGVSQEEFAKRLDTTPKTLSKIINGEQRLSANIALKLSRMLGTSAQYWLNIQAAFDVLLAEKNAGEARQEERSVLRQLGYGYFRDHFGLPALPRQIDEQVACVRRFLKIGSLTVLRTPNLTTCFRQAAPVMDPATVVRANAMVQIAVNASLEANAPRYDRKRFEQAAQFALTQTRSHDGFLERVREEFLKAGVIFVVLPNLSGSKTNGATRRVNDRVVLMVNDRRLSADVFWFTLFHEIGHILSDDFGISLEGDSGSREDAADAYARNMLIDQEGYDAFVAAGHFTPDSVTAFAESVGRDVGIVVGRLQNDGFVRYNDSRFNSLKTRYRVAVS